jgi:pimeloyl-ACP methyl ester carboxylesterase
MTDLPIHHFRGRDGAELAYRELGEGRPVVLVHGYLSTAMVSWVRTGHAGTIAARGYRVIMPDLRGHGDSAKPHDAVAYPPDVLADDGLALIEHLGLTDYDLGGYSLGGRTVARILVRGATPGRAVVGGQGLDAITHTVGRGGNFRRVLTGLGTFERGSPERAMEDWIKTAGGDPVALLHILDTFVDTPREALARIETPTLVLTAAEDGHNRTAGALAAALPHGQYAVLPGDHGSAATSPEFVTAITGFLTGRSA